MVVEVGKAQPNITWIFLIYTVVWCALIRFYAILSEFLRFFILPSSLKGNSKIFSVGNLALLIVYTLALTKFWLVITHGTRYVLTKLPKNYV